MADLDVSVILRLVDQLSTPARNAANRIRGIQNNLNNFSNSAMRHGRNLSMFVTAPLVLLGKKALDVSRNMEDATNKLVALVGVDRKVAEGMQKSIIELARETGRSLSELTDAQFFTESAFGGKDAIASAEALAESARAAASGLGDTKTIAHAVTSAMSAYKKMGLTAEDATSILISGVKEGKLEAADFAGVLGKVTGVAGELGIRFDDLVASIAAMTPVGASAREASVAVGQLMNSLLKPSAEARDAFELPLEKGGLGLRLIEMRKLLKEEDGILKVLLLIREQIEKMPDQALGEEMLAKVFPNVRALRGALNLAGQNVERTKEIFEGVSKYAGASRRAFRETEGTTRALQQLNVEWEILNLGVGNTLARSLVPKVKQLNKWLAELSHKWEALNESTKDWIINAGLFAVVVGPALIVLAVLARAVSTLLIPVVALTGGFAKLLTKIKTIGAGGAVMAAGRVLNRFLGPLFLIGAGFYAIWENWQLVKPAWEEVKKSADNVVRALEPVGKAINNIVKSITGGIGLGQIFDDWDTEGANDAAAALNKFADGLQRVADIINAFVNEGPLAGLKELTGGLGDLAKSDFGFGTFKTRKGSPLDWLTGGKFTETPESPASTFPTILPPVGVPQSSGSGPLLQPITPNMSVPPRGINPLLKPQSAPKASSGSVDRLKQTLNSLSGSKAPASASANMSPIGDKLPAGLVIQSQGPVVRVIQAPPNVVVNSTVNVQSPDSAPEATANAVGRKTGERLQSQMGDGVHY